MSNFPEQWKKEWFTTIWVFLINKEWQEVCNYMFLENWDYTANEFKNIYWDLSLQSYGSMKDNNIKMF